MSIHWAYRVLLVYLLLASAGFQAIAAVEISAAAKTSASTEKPIAPENQSIRLIIDISGSMKKNDPHNLRIPAVNLLVNILPHNAHAGVWTFGKYVNGLIAFQQTDEKWKKDALKRSQQIDSSGLYTNIGAALEKSILTDSSSGTAILLTDGVVDISKDPAVNKFEKNRILEEVIPKLIDADVQVHTVALSENADVDLLQEIASRTDGLFEVALTPEALTRIFLRMFDDAVKQDQLPLEGGSFDVDSSIEEFTLLVFVAPGSIPVQLRSPENNFYLANSHPAHVTWYRDNGYELITVARPLEGNWKLFSDDDPQNRVTILSDLKLEVTNLQNTIYAGDEPTIEAYFLQDTKVVLDEKFLDLMDVQLIVKTPSGELLAKRLGDNKQGVYSTLLDLFKESGRYLIKVSVDGRTFKREFIQEVIFEAGVALSHVDNKIQFTPNSAILSSPLLKVIATLTDETEKRRFIPLTLDANGNWQAALNNIDKGKYDVFVNIKGETETGRNVSLNSNHLEIEINNGTNPESDAESTEEESDSAPWWEKYLAQILIAFGNILVIGLGIWLYLRRKKDSLLEDEKIQGEDIEDIEGVDDARERPKDDLEVGARGKNVDDPPTEVTVSEEVEPQGEIEASDEAPMDADISNLDSSDSNQEEGLSDIVDAWGDDLSEEPSAPNEEPSAPNEAPSALDEDPSALNDEISLDTQEETESDPPEDSEE